MNKVTSAAAVAMTETATIARMSFLESVIVIFNFLYLLSFGYLSHRAPPRRFAGKKQSYAQKVGENTWKLGASGWQRSEFNNSGIEG